MASLIGAQIYIRRKCSPKPVSSFYFSGPLPPTSSYQPTVVSSPLPTCSPYSLPLVPLHDPPQASPRLTGLTPLTKAGPAHHCLSVAVGGGNGWRGWQWAQERGEVAELALGYRQTLGRGVNWDLGQLESPQFHLQKSCFCPRQSITQFIGRTRARSLLSLIFTYINSHS